MNGPTHSSVTRPHITSQNEFPWTFYHHKVQVWLDYQQEEQHQGLEDERQRKLKRKRTPFSIMCSDSASEVLSSPKSFRIRRAFEITTGNIMSYETRNPPPDLQPKDVISKRTPGSQIFSKKRQIVRKSPTRGDEGGTGQQVPLRTSPRKNASIPSTENSAQDGSPQSGLYSPADPRMYNELSRGGGRGRGRGRDPRDNLRMQTRNAADHNALSLRPTRSYEEAFSSPVIDDLAFTSAVSSNLSITTTASTSARSRPSSPVKNMHDLTMAMPPIKFCEGDKETMVPPNRVSQLYEKILASCDGYELLPRSLKDEISSHSAKTEHRVLRDTQFNAAPVSPAQAEMDLELWKAVKRIRKKAARCSENSWCEAGWGEAVYSQVLETALEFSDYEDLVEWINITPARIEPKALIPKHINSNTLASKMVDYALFLRVSEPDVVEILRHLPEEEMNINHTRFAPTRYNPITVNIEVKVPGEGGNQAMVQLAVWTSAQFTKLNALAGRVVTDLGIPLMLVEGHEWRIFIAYQKDDGTMIVWGNDRVGDTKSVLGIYMTIAVIQQLAEWSYTEFRHWFEAEILGVGDNTSLLHEG